jgi:hypothetical protein
MLTWCTLQHLGHGGWLLLLLVVVVVVVVVLIPRGTTQPPGAATGQATIHPIARTAHTADQCCQLGAAQPWPTALRSSQTLHGGMQLHPASSASSCCRCRCRCRCRRRRCC